MRIPENIASKARYKYSHEAFTDEVGGIHKGTNGIAPNGRACSGCTHASCASCPTWWFICRKEEARAAVQERKEEERRDIAIRMITAGKLSLEEVAEYLALPLKSVMEIKNSI